MRVDLIVAGRFHAFDLARELDRLGALGTVHTGYPSFFAPRFGLRASAVRTCWPYTVTAYAASRLGPFARLASSGLHLIRAFDRLVATRLRGDAEVVVGWSNQSTAALRRARELGALTVVERGSTHIEWQRDVLAEEAMRTGIAIELPDPRFVARELSDYEEADLIAVPSAFVARTFVERGISPKKIVVNPYGVDLAHFRPSTTKRSCPNGSLRVIHVGRVGARKGVHYLVEAARLAGAELTLVGAVEPGFANRIGSSRAIGAVPGKHLPAYYSRADVFCLLSLEEGLALVIAQAMAMGLPVVATPNSGAEELVSDGVEGFLVPPRNPEAAADRLRRLAEDADLCAAMGERARKRVMSGFSWAEYGARAIDIYERGLLARGTFA